MKESLRIRLTTNKPWCVSMLKREFGFDANFCENDTLTLNWDLSIDVPNCTEHAVHRIHAVAESKSGLTIEYPKDALQSMIQRTEHLLGILNLMKESL